MTSPGMCSKEGYDRDLSLRSVGPGWAALINDLWDQIDRDNLPVRVVQVKEKFGGLRFYYDWLGGKPSDGSFREQVHEAENASFKICEECGQPGQTGGSGWIRTLCSACRAKKRHGDNF